MKKRAMVLVLVLVVGVAGGAASWWTLRPEPSPLPGGDKAYEEIPRSDYELWMQDLGYVD